jgi:hypothetical protein
MKDLSKFLQENTTMTEEESDYITSVVDEYEATETNDDQLISEAKKNKDDQNCLGCNKKMKAGEGKKVKGKWMCKGCASKKKESLAKFFKEQTTMTKDESAFVAEVVSKFEEVYDGDAEQTAYYELRSAINNLFKAGLGVDDVKRHLDAIFEELENEEDLYGDDQDPEMDGDILIPADEETEEEV